VSAVRTREPGPARVTQVGRALPRVEDLTLLQGSAGYVGDFDREGQVWARVVRSTSAHARILSIDVGRALRAGAIRAITAADVPDVRIPVRIAGSSRCTLALQPPLARDVVRFVGEPLAVVLASDPYEAEDLGDLVEVELEDLPPVVDVRAAVEPSAAVLFDELGSNEVDTMTFRSGRPFDELAAGAAVVVTERLSVGRDAAMPLETRGLVAEYDRAQDAISLWGATKVKHFNRRALAAMLGIDVERVRLIELAVGGSFGARGELYPEDFLIPWLARDCGRPVKWIEDRAEHFVATNQCRDQACDIELAASAQGRLLGLRARSLVNVGGYVRTQGLVLARITARHLAGPYDWEGIEAHSTAVVTAKTPSGTFRAPGQYDATFFRERAIDILARRLGADPAELRLANLIGADRAPRAYPTEGQSAFVHTAGNYREIWSRMLQRGRYADARRETALRRERGERVGIGVCAFVEEAAENQFEQARVVPRQDGIFQVQVGVAASGQGIATALTQVAADALGVDPERIEVTYHDTDVVPEGMGTYASRAATFGGNAVVGAVADLFAEVRRVAADRFGAEADEVTIADGFARAGERAAPLHELGAIGEFRYERREAEVAMGASLAVVRIEAGTGDVTVERHVVAFDVGRAINPQIVTGQLVGGAVQGIAGALLQSLEHDEFGQPLTVSFLDYGIPTAGETPTVEVELLQSSTAEDTPDGELGVKGCGETGVVGAGGAIANAVAAALGCGDAVLMLPLRPERVRSLLIGAEGA
jgi:carbon-monoxide dehydrogenase large subunit